MSATPDSTLADPKDHLIADLQRQLAERDAERDEALAQETATAEVLQVINSSPGDLAPVFDAMLEKAMRLCGAAFGAFAIYDGRSIPVRRCAWRAEQFAVSLTRANHSCPRMESTWLRMLSGEDVVHIPDAREMTTSYRADTCG